MTSVALVSTKGLEHSDWLQWRKQGIGGSDAAAIAGLSKWKSPMAVYLEKIGAIEPDEAGEAASWGTKLEKVIAEEFALQTGLKIQRRNSILRHKEHYFMLANVDRIIIDKTNGNGVLEVKTTSVYNKDAWTDGKIPDEYMLQIQHYLAVTGLAYAYVAVLIGGQKYHHQHIPRDNELIAYLIQIESDFWKLVENKTPPEMDGSDSSSDVLNYLYPQANPDSKIDLPPTAELLVGEYEWASSEEKQWAIRKEEAANKLKAMLGEYEVGMAGSKKINWKNVTSNRLDSKSLKADMPDIYQKYSKESYTRRFTIAAIKG